MKEFVQKISVILFFTLGAIILGLLFYGLFCTLWVIPVSDVIWKLAITLMMPEIVIGFVMVLTV